MSLYVLFPQPRVLLVSFSTWKTSIHHPSLSMSVNSANICRAHKYSKLLSNGDTKMKRERESSHPQVALSNGGTVKLGQD